MAIINPDLILQYAEIHREKVYGQTSRLFIPEIMACLLDLRPQRVLEYGCGQSFLGESVADFPAQWFRYDPAIPQHAEPPSGSFDLVICIDVMEHIPEADVPDVIHHIRTLSRRAFFNIATRPARQVLPNGDNAHCTVWPAERWEQVLCDLFPESVLVRNDPGLACTFMTWKSPGVTLVSEIMRLKSQGHL